MEAVFATTAGNCGKRIARLTLTHHQGRWIALGRRGWCHWLCAARVNAAVMKQYGGINKLLMNENG
jgi:hypothetical protein